MLSAGDIKRLLTREGVSYWVAFGTFSHNVALVSESKSDEHLSLVDEIPAVWLCGRMEQAEIEIIVRAFFRVVSPEGPTVLDRPSVSYQRPWRLRSDKSRRTG